MQEGRQPEFGNLAETLPAGNLRYARLLRPDGTLIASTLPDDDVAGSPPDIPSGMRVAEEDGTPYYTLTMPIRNDTSCRTCHASDEDPLAFLTVSVAKEETRRSISELKRTTVLSALLVIIGVSGSVLLTTFLLIYAPLKRLARTTTEAGNPPPHPPASGGDEIAMIEQRLGSVLSELAASRRQIEAYNIETMQKVEKMVNIGELAAVIAHEIKNPLAGISGAIQVFYEDFPPEDPRREIITDILTEIERLDKAVRDLLSFARPPEPHPIKTPVENVIDRCVRLVGGQAKKQGVEVILISLEDPVDVDIDPEQMQQVFLNLMMNALHSMPAGGTLTVAVHVSRDEGHVDVTFSDTGQGVRAEDIANIFKPFYTTKQTGTGLGLAISKNVVENHGGTIHVESTLGSGTLFRIRLPIEGGHV
jgi:signal transduction histidine kinase